MRFEWDEAKNESNIIDHGFDFAEALDLFRGPLLTREDTRDDYGETRWKGIGLLQYEIAVVIFVEKIGDIIRIISLRLATAYEKLEFQHYLQDQLGQD